MLVVCPLLFNKPPTQQPVLVLAWPHLGLFKDIIGLIGAITFWPSTVYFPITMYAKVHSPLPWQRAVMQVVNISCCVVSVLAAVGSAWNIAQDSHSYALFGAG
jgi:hypothetical protein